MLQFSNKIRKNTSFTESIILFIALIILFPSLTNEYIIEKAEGITSEEQSDITPLNQKSQSSTKSSDLQEQQQQQQSQSTNSSNIVDNPISIIDLINQSSIKGKANASVSIIEFSDFQCPYCAFFYSEVLPQLEKDYINTEKLNLVYKHFPLVQVHSNTYDASNAAECAREQSKFWEYHDILWQTQNEWANQIIDIAIDKFKDFALHLGLNSMDFDFCFYAKKYSNKIYNDYQQGLKYGVSATPSFFIINNYNEEYDILVGVQSYSIFKQIIDQYLNVH